MKYYGAAHYQLGKKQNRYKNYIFTSQYTPKEISSKIKRLVVRNKVIRKLDASEYLLHSSYEIYKSINMIYWQNHKKLTERF